MTDNGIGYSTQIGPYPNLSQKINGTKIAFVYEEGMNQRQIYQMDEAKTIVNKFSHIMVLNPTDINQVSPEDETFIIGFLNDNIIKSIRSRVAKARIATARSVIESFKYRRLSQFPVRSVMISLAMLDCNVFLDKSACTTTMKKKIYEMSGLLAREFLSGEESKVNVVVTSRADSRYSARARKMNIPVVSTQWVEDAYVTSSSHMDEALNFDAIKTVPTYRIKPFHGLFFKMRAPDIAGHLKTLITDNGGRVAYGISDKVTHVVETKYPDDDSIVEPRVVDAEFLELCSTRGYYLTRTEYREYLEARGTTVKLEPISQASRSNMVQSNNAFTPPIPNARSTCSSAYSSDRENRNDENHTMLPPTSSAPRSQARRKCRPSQILSESLDSLAQPQQTQMPSTQIRRMPDNLLPLESSNEPSQQLIWLERGDRTRRAR